MDFRGHKSEVLTYKDVWPLKSTTEPSLRTPFSSTVPRQSRHSEINSSEESNHQPEQGFGPGESQDAYNDEKGIDNSCGEKPYPCTLRDYF